MLNKEVCRKCCGKHYGVGKLCVSYRYFDVRWDKKGFVACPIQFWYSAFSPFKSGMAKVKNKTPKWCPYKLEHIMLKGNY